MKRTSVEHFRRLFSRNQACEICDRQYHSLVEYYEQPHRKYHTLDHVERSLHLFDEVRLQAEDAFAVEAALWFHDVVYEVTSLENEEKSADLCRNFLSSIGADTETIERTCSNILATSLNILPESPDEQLIRDIDIGVFGSLDETFDEYEKAIREEYAFVEEQQYIVARFQVLKSFLLEEAVYKTPHFFASVRRKPDGTFSDPFSDCLKRPAIRFPLMEYHSVSEILLFHNQAVSSVLTTIFLFSLLKVR